MELALLVLQNDAATPVTWVGAAKRPNAWRPEQMARLRRSCVGEAQPLGKRKRLSEAL